ncbi:MAG TPA: N-formylglutamate amidohydrolase [Polyangiaceae bacterium]|nr:N-formylglutamate amidohydrolase [Polyangiaceae bacterium]
MTFVVTEPRAPEVPVIVEVPHAGLEVDAETLANLVAPAQAIGRDADLYVDELYADAPDAGATLLCARMSRYVCDLNRSEHDVDRDTVLGATGRASPHGLIWRSTTDNRAAVARPLPKAELERRLNSYYRPYHDQLDVLVRDRLARHGFVIVVSGHSMPSRGRDGHDDPGRERADVVPGTRQRTTAAQAVIEATEQVAARFQLGLAHDEPYRGGHTTVRYGRPAAGIHAIQIELNRRLYMDETTLAKKPNEFRTIRSFCKALVRELAALRQVPLAEARRG